MHETALFLWNKHETALLEEPDDSRLYPCGSHLFPPSSSHYESIVVRASLSCTDPVEVQYYSATLASFAQVCYFCGLMFNYKYLGIGIQYCKLNGGSFPTIQFHDYRYHQED